MTGERERLLAMGLALAIWAAIIGGAVWMCGCTRLTVTLPDGTEARYDYLLQDKTATYERVAADGSYESLTFGNRADPAVEVFREAAKLAMAGAAGGAAQ